MVKKSGAAGNEAYGYDGHNRLVEYSLDDGSKKETYRNESDE